MATWKAETNGIELLIIENDWGLVKVAPALGGKMVSIFHKGLDHEFLWTNSLLPLTKYTSGEEYDSHFYGGIDELIPNDVPEIIDGISYPDHGELWTTELTGEIFAGSILVKGTLPLSGLYYQKSVRLDRERPVIYLDYHIKNKTATTKHFLWKLHAPVNIQPGDLLVSTAAQGQVVDPSYSRFTSTEPFDWPMISGSNAAVVPAKDKTVDFFYLYDVQKPEMHMSLKNDEYLFGYRYDPAVFPFQWYFASYGGFLDHYTAILEPCSSMPMSVTDAMKKNQCSVLEPGESLRTTVEIFAGERKSYKSGHA